MNTKIDLKKHPCNPNNGFYFPEWVDKVLLERFKQTKMGYTDEHDGQHDRGELVEAAICFAKQSIHHNHRPYIPSADWPWELESWHPADTPNENIIKAISLLVAEYERLQRNNKIALQ